MYMSRGECPEKAANCSVENPSRVVMRGSAPYLISTLAIGKLLSKQDSWRAVRPSQLNWLTLIWAAEAASRASMAGTSPASITDWKVRCTLSLTLTVTGACGPRIWAKGNVVTGLKGCSISSYLLANRGLLLTKSWQLVFLFRGGLLDGLQGDAGDKGGLSYSSAESSEGWSSEKAGE